MIRIKLIILGAILITFTNCKTGENKFPIDKRYWDLNDYDNIVRHLNYGYEKDEKLPSFDDPETKIIVKKLTDQENFKVVLEDKELGIKHRNNVAEKFFEEWKEMMKIYDSLDRKDKYLYDKEMLAVWQFGLALQLRYFKLGNDQIIENSDDPTSLVTKSNVKSNIKTLINNYQIYLDEVNNESAFTDSGIIKLAEGIDVYFTELVQLYPKANYSGMKKKAELMFKKSDSERIKTSLEKLIKLITSKEIVNVN